MLKPSTSRADHKQKTDRPAPSLLIETTPARGASSKLDRVIVLLQRSEGASLTELCSETSWQTHSVRGAIAGSLKRKGHAVTSERIDGIRRYRIEVRT